MLNTRYRRLARSLLILVALSAAPSMVSAQHLILPLNSDSRPTDVLDDSDCVATSKPTSQVPALPPQPPSKPVNRLFGRLLSDEKAIWTSPLEVRREQLKWIVPLASTTVVMISTDNRAIGGLRSAKDLAEDSRDLSGLGSGFATFGAAAGIYTVGKLTHNERAAETGLLGVEALIHGSIVANVLKLATARERPNKIQGDGGFWDRGNSFPSGHSTVIWTLATVIAEEYKGKPLIRFGAYGLAAAVAAARFTGQNHFPSDVLVGSALGYLIGHYIVKRHGS